MKSFAQFSGQWARWRWISLLGLWMPASLVAATDTNSPPVAATNAPPAAATKAPAATTNAPAASAPALTPEQAFEGGTNTYSNWIDLSAGGFFSSGNRAQFEQRQSSWSGPFGGIEDFHYQHPIDKNTTFTADGRALFDQRDYRLNLDVTRDKLGFLRFYYNEFQTWYNGSGGFYPPSDSFYHLPSGDELTLDRGDISVEAGLRMDKVPKITFKYTHSFRDGDKSSTIWGATHPAVGVTQGLSPSFYDINERSDTFQLDVQHKIKATDLALGFSYQNGKLDDALKIDQAPGEPIERRITDQQGTSYDLFNVHASTETWIKKNLMFSSGYSFSDLDNDFSGSRIYGTDFDVGYVPSAANGFGYFGLNGGSRMQEYVMDLNLYTVPWKPLTVVPSVRVQKEDTHADVSGFETLGANPAAPFNTLSDQGILDVRERLDVNYTGITNWVLNARGEWTEGDGKVTANGGLGPIGGIGVSPIQQETEDGRLFQKYSVGAKWYVDRRVTFDFGGYYKLNDYNYDNRVDSTLNNSADRYPAYLVMQSFDTYDGHAGVTLRPRPNITLVSRYEYQWSTIHTTPDSVSGLGETESSRMQSQIIAQNIGWSPWSRLTMQLGFNYVLSQTRSPVSDITQAVLAAQNNYWTLNFTTGLALDDKTDLNLGYFYYRADDYSDNSIAGVPYGAGAEEHGITAGIVRQLSKNVRLSLKYGYSHYTDSLYGGNNNFQSHLVYASLRYRF